MEFVEATSSKVTDIAIPEGNVIKIEEAATGRVLWEKASLNINPSWTRQNSTLINPHDTSGTRQIYLMARAAATSTDYCTLFTTTNPHSQFTNTLDMAGCQTIIGMNSNLGRNYGANDTKIIYRSTFAAYGERQNVRVIAVTKDAQPNERNNNKTGLLLLYDGNTNNYGFYPVTSSILSMVLDNTFLTPVLNINSQPNGQVYITLAPDRDEFLITGLSDGSLILPTTLNSSTPVNFNSSGSHLLRTCRAPDLGLYFATSRVIKRSLYYSTDGVSWEAVFPFLSSDVLGVEYISEKKLVCAVSSNESKIALSTDGITWTERTAPFINALAFDYAPEHDLFCVVDNKAAYLTQNFYQWITVPLPNNATFEFTNLLYTADGIFFGHKYGESDIYILFTDEVLWIFNPFFSS